MKNWIALQIKPAGELCNCACVYCYNPKTVEKRGLMSREVLDTLLEKYSKYSPEHLIISWHGGEPTLAGLDFFKHAQAKLTKLGYKKENLTQSIQTNATLLTDDFAKFFKKSGYKVGVSLDGPETIHNAHRRLKTGVGSFAKTMMGVDVLRRNNVPFGVICTVSKRTHKNAKKILNFFVENNIYNLSFSPIANVGEGSKDNSLVLTSDEWLRFLRDLFKEWCKLDNERIQIRELNETIAWIIGKPLRCCSSQNSCANWLSVEPNGDVFACEYYNAEEPYGNILREDFKDVIKSSCFKEFKNNQRFVNEKCEACDYYKLCGNGCSKLRLTNGQQDLKGLYQYCDVRKKMFVEVRDYFNKVMSTTKAGDKRVN